MSSGFTGFVIWLVGWRGVVWGQFDPLAGTIMGQLGTTSQGGARYFYARSGDILQRRDDQDATLLAVIREKRIIPTGSEPALAEFVANLVLRTKNIRQRATGLVEAASDHVRKTVRQPRWLEEFSRPLIEADLRNQLGENPPRWMRRKFRQEQRKRVKKLPHMFDTVMDRVSFPTAVRDGQTRALETGLTTTAVQPYKKLCWTVSAFRLAARSF